MGFVISSKPDSKPHDWVTPDQVQENSQWHRRFWWLLLILVCWRLFYITITPLDLVPDEAYYWDWSRNLAWGYYSKPPLVAWVNALSTALFGTSAFTVRLPAVILGSFSLIALYYLGARLFDHRVAFWSVAAMAATPMSTGFAFLMTIDTLLICFWILALYALWRAMDDHNDNKRWWLLSALAIGLGLLSKQIMLMFLVLAALHLVLSQAHRKWLASPWPYLTALLALLALTPMLWWNMNHDWITFQHTAHNLGLPSQSREPHEFILTFLRFIGTQLFIVSPLTWPLLVIAGLPLLARLHKIDDRIRFLVLFSIVPLMFFVIASFTKKINANWPAAFYPAGMVLLAAWAEGALSSQKGNAPRRRLFVAGVVVGALFVVLTYALTFVLKDADLGGGKLDPTRRLKGWQNLAETVEQIRREMPRPDETFLLASGRQYVSELAFYLPNRPRVYRWNERPGLVQTQYELWPGPHDKLGWDALIIFEPHLPLYPDLVQAFDKVTLLDEVAVPIGPAGSRQLVIYLGHNLKHWPRI